MPAVFVDQDALWSYIDDELSEWELANKTAQELLRTGADTKLLLDRVAWAAREHV